MWCWDGVRGSDGRRPPPQHTLQRVLADNCATGSTFRRWLMSFGGVLQCQALPDHGELELRLNPPNVVVDNECYPWATKVMVGMRTISELEVIQGPKSRPRHIEEEVVSVRTCRRTCTYEY